jgi:hypothetical protein
MWSSNRDDPDQSEQPGKMSGLVGINPWGRTDLQHRTTIWGKEALEAYDQWIEIAVIAQA